MLKFRCAARALQPFSGVDLVVLGLDPMGKMDPIRVKDAALCDQSLMSRWLYGVAGAPDTPLEANASGTRKLFAFC